jgi:hypothetical protein
MESQMYIISIYRLMFFGHIVWTHGFLWVIPVVSH